jgi:hypothetical protein
MGSETQNLLSLVFLLWSFILFFRMISMLLLIVYAFIDDDVDVNDVDVR